MIKLDALPLGPSSQRRLTLEWSAGAAYALIGRNGVGKTTLLKKILTPHPQVVVGGRRHLPQHFLSQQISWLPQELSCPFPYSARQIMLMCRFAFHQGRPQAEDQKICEDWAEKFCIQDLLDRPITKLSTGERRMVFVAATVARQTPILLLDEPLANLDPLNQKFLVDRFIDLSKLGRCLVVAMHEWHQIPRFCDRIDLLSEDRILSLPRDHEIGDLYTRA